MSELCPKCNRQTVRTTLVVGQETYSTCTACNYENTQPSAPSFKEMRMRE